MCGDPAAAAGCLPDGLIELGEVLPQRGHPLATGGLGRLVVGEGGAPPIDLGVDPIDRCLQRWESRRGTFRGSQFGAHPFQVGLAAAALRVAGVPPAQEQDVRRCAHVVRQPTDQAVSTGIRRTSARRGTCRRDTPLE